MHIVALSSTPVINLRQLMTLLKSKDEALWERSKWMFDGQFRYLDGQPNKSQKIAFCSFPRSGNTFLRKYLELLTGIQTGSDNTLDVNVFLQMMGMKGEDIVDDTVWVVKSHSPWIMPFAPVFHANKLIIVVRNPLETALSWLNLVAMNNHVQKAPFKYDELYPNWWDWWVHDIVGYIHDWMKQMMDDAKYRKVPTLFVRFEDLINNPEPEIKSMMRFLLNESDLTGMNAERRIQEVLSMGQGATLTYNLKATTKMKNANKCRYT